MNFKNILCPIDFSRLSDVAIERASQIAKHQQARIHFVHVYEPIFTDDAMLGAPLPADLQPRKIQLEAVRPTCDGIDFVHEMIFGFPAGALVAYARSHKIDLIVIGTHGRTGPSRMLMGSVAETVVRRASCPVLTVHEKALVAEA